MRYELICINKCFEHKLLTGLICKIYMEVFYNISNITNINNQKLLRILLITAMVVFNIVYSCWPSYHV